MSLTPIQEKIARLSKGNLGALRFLMDLESKGHLEYIEKIEATTIRGSDIYVLSSDICDDNLELLDNLLNFCPKGILEDACSRQDYSGIDLVAEYLHR